MGFCPQHDVLFPDLTVKEHLELFSIFKSQKFEKEEIIKAIIEVDLEKEINTLSKNLSGG